MQAMEDILIDFIPPNIFMSLCVEVVDTYCLVSLEVSFSFPETLTSWLESDLFWLVVSLEGNIHAIAAPAVPSPLCREKHKKVAHTNAQQPVNVVRMYKGTKAKFRNCTKGQNISPVLYVLRNFSLQSCVMSSLPSRKLTPV